MFCASPSLCDVSVLMGIVYRYHAYCGPSCHPAMVVGIVHATGQRIRRETYIDISLTDISMRMMSASWGRCWCCTSARQLQ